MKRCATLDHLVQSLRSKRRAGARSIKTGGDAISRPALLSLPNETLLHIVNYLNESDLWALCLVNRRLAILAGEPLYKNLYNDLTRCQEVLLWAVEVANHDILRQMLEKDVDPNFFYQSPLLRSRLLDVLAAQRRHGTLKPHDDRMLSTEIFREQYCRSGRVRRRTHLARELHRRVAPMELDVDWNRTHTDWYGEDLRDSKLRNFGIVEQAAHPITKKFWTWTPLHVAVQRGDDKAVHLLLDHGADVDAQCSGLCDCAAPSLNGEDVPNDSIKPQRLRSTWTSLHVAMCAGHEKTAQLLIDRKASRITGALIHQPVALYRKVRMSMPAFYTAASLGSVTMCNILLKERHFQVWLDVNTRGDENVLHVAAAEGHIRTVGKLLLQNGAKLVPNYYSSNGTPPHRPVHDPLRLLCMQHRYDDARWLIKFCQPLNSYADGDPVHHYTRSLAVLCYLRPPAAYNSLSLRERQDHLYNLTPLDLNSQTRDRIAVDQIKTSEPKRLSIAKLLLNLGADPDRAESTFDGKITVTVPSGGGPLMDHRTPLQLAAGCGFTKMVKLLISRGANCDQPSHGSDGSLQSPLYLAVQQALKPRGNVETVKVLLDAGASLYCGDHCLLEVVAWRRPENNPSISAGHDWPSFHDWLHIVELFLRHGAADLVDSDTWKRIISQACAPGNMSYCEMLEKARSISGFTPSMYAIMLELAVSRCWIDPEANGFLQDTEVISWVLRHCVDADGRLIITRSIVSDLQQEAYSHRMKRIAELLRKFLAETKVAEDTSIASPSSVGQQ